LREGKAHFAGLLRKGGQTRKGDANVTRNLLHPILRSENARTPGLNAVACDNEEKMGEALKELSKAGGRGPEGHIRFHLGVGEETHRIAVDAFRHRGGGFTLIAVDSLPNPHFAATSLAMLEMKYPKDIKGTLVIITPNQAHIDGCQIFGVHTLNAMHDYQPYMQSLHRELHDNALGKPAPRLADPMWNHTMGNTYVLEDDVEAFGILPGKFFKHMQVPKPRPGETRTLLDEAEEKNPALKDQAVNKKGQTLRERFAGQNPGKPPEEFSRADRTLSLDMKRIALIDRAIEHFETLPLRPQGMSVEA
jgi:hypothetical protein